MLVNSYIIRFKIDKQDEQITKEEAMKIDFLNKKVFPNFNYDEPPIGEILSVKFDDIGVLATMQLVDDHPFNLEEKAFGIHGIMDHENYEVKDGITLLKNIELYSVSLIPKELSVHYDKDEKPNA